MAEPCSGWGATCATAVIAQCLHLDVGRMVVDPTVFVLWERRRDLVEYRDVVLQEDCFQEYLRGSEDCYARPRVVTLLEPIALTSSEHTPVPSRSTGAAVCEPAQRPGASPPEAAGFHGPPSSR